MSARHGESDTDSGSPQVHTWGHFILSFLASHRIYYAVNKLKGTVDQLKTCIFKYYML